jgi:5-methyltetrahydrofolate--homocysteine methyltransferase
VSVSHPILSRLDTGRPLLLGGDPLASLRARGVALHPPAGLGRLLRESPAAAREHYHQEIACGVDVLACLTSDTIPRALQQIGMAFRAAALTGCAVDLALDVADVAPRPVIVAGVLGNERVPPAAEDRIGEELGTHAARLAAAGCELILARGFGLAREPVFHASAARDSSLPAPVDPALVRIARRAAIVSGAMTGLPTWAVIPVDHGGFTVDGASAEECARHAFDEGARVVVLEVPLVEVAFAWIDRLQALGGHVGFAPAAAGLDPDAWATEAKHLLEAGSRVLGGGPGVTQRHIAALHAQLRSHDRPSLWPRPLWDPQRSSDDVRE